MLPFREVLAFLGRQDPLGSQAKLPEFRPGVRTLATSATEQQQQQQYLPGGSGFLPHKSLVSLSEAVRGKRVMGEACDGEFRASPPWLLSKT